MVGDVGIEPTLSQCKCESLPLQSIPHKIQSSVYSRFTNGLDWFFGCQRLDGNLCGAPSRSRTVYVFRQTFCRRLHQAVLVMVLKFSSFIQNS